ncbi:MAG: hypothetical protein Ct9H300mP11_13980 [Chloroflexota bacterium]|nr:MAG: hypothetical protein Ct9H300mP11_13980 [Chloroflexota bacterium]
MLPMIRFAYVMAIRRAVSGWALGGGFYSAVFYWPFTLMASSVIFL